MLFRLNCGVQFNKCDLQTISIDPGVPATIFELNFSYELPFGKGKRFLASASRLVDSVL
jgi:hypothetical protein